MKLIHIGVPRKSLVFMTLPSSSVTSIEGAFWPTARPTTGVPDEIGAELGTFDGGRLTRASVGSGGMLGGTGDDGAGCSPSAEVSRKTARTAPTTSAPIAPRTS